MFFDQYIQKGNFPGQRFQFRQGCGPIHSREWIIENIMTPDIRWGYDAMTGNPNRFIDRLAGEIGSIKYQGRLTLLDSRVNNRKGKLFAVADAVGLGKFLAYSNSTQLAIIKEIGSVFTYMQTDEAWEAFSATYNQIYKLLGEFDRYYHVWHALKHLQKSATDSIYLQEKHSHEPAPKLQLHFSQFIRLLMDSIISRTRETMGFYYAYAIKQQQNRGLSSRLKYWLIFGMGSPVKQYPDRIYFRADICKGLPGTYYGP
ncbi:hypothetical protein RUND412_007454 [Rhizina undulata]